MKRKSIIQGFPTCAAFLIFVVLFSGCVGPPVRTYGGDKLQKSEVAVIKGWWFFFLFGYAGQDIDNVDGNELLATRVEVLPGWHELDIRDYTFGFLPWGGSTVRNAHVAYSFEAGHKYKIKYRGLFDDDFYIVDVSTGAIIWSYFGN